VLEEHEKREEREKASLENHRRLSRLFREDRLAFERERKRRILEVIESANDEALKGKLLDLQARWDKRMRGAGSEHNRFVLAQTFFWDHFHTTWKPAMDEIRNRLGRPQG
jgi:hypothetical protein